MFKWRKSKKEKAFSIPFWKRLFICFGKPLWVYHNLLTGRIDCEFVEPSQTHYRIPIAKVTGHFSIPAGPLCFEYFDIREAQGFLTSVEGPEGLLVSREQIKNYINSFNHREEIL